MARKRLSKVSIIVVNWNGREVLKDCLKSLSAITYPDWELILVDNGSTDSSQKLPKQVLGSKVRIIVVSNPENLGFAKANNQGAEKSTGKYILLLNNDTKVTPGFLEPLVKRMEDDAAIGVLQPKIYLMDNPGYLDNAGSFITRIGFWHHWGFLQKDSAEFSQEREIFAAKGACMLIRREIIKKVGLFDRDFVSYFEETDFCWRVWLAGYKVLFFPKTHIYHKVGFTIRRQNVLNLNFHYYKNRIAAQIKNFEAKNIFFILFPHMIVSLGIAAVFVLRFNFSNALMILRAIAWNILNLSNILEKRGKIQAKRTVSDDLLFEKLLVPVDWKKFVGDFNRLEEDIKRKNSQE